MTDRIPPEQAWREEEDRERTVIDALVEEAVDADSECRDYDAERLAEAVGILIERFSLDKLDPGSFVAGLMEPTRRARAAGRPLPGEDIGPAARLRLLRTLQRYADADGRYAEAEQIREDADAIEEEIEAEPADPEHPYLPRHLDLTEAGELEWITRQRERAIAYRELADNATAESARQRYEGWAAETDRSIDSFFASLGRAELGRRYGGSSED